MTRRTLDIIPILHDATDLGSVAGVLRVRVGDEAFTRRQSMIREFWESVRGYARGVDDAARLVVYQDGLPAVPEAPRIVADLAQRGSANHRLLADLIAAGATVEGTEDPALLVKEYELARSAAEAFGKGQNPDPRHEQRARAVLEERDRFIAARIAQTLPTHSRGLLLIGLLHRVEAYLPDDMIVKHPMGRPTRRAAV